MDIGPEEKKKKTEAFQDADIDEHEPNANHTGKGGGGESSDDEAVVGF